MSIIIFIIILLVLVLVHEFGHFFTAKRFGIRVDEFGFGFPPKLFGVKKGETEYTFNALPLGGFVKIFGENPDDENTNGPDSKRSFVNKPKWQQACVLFAGIFANFLLAWLLLSFGFMSGVPVSVGNETTYALKDVHLVIISVSKDSPAEIAGLKSGDKIISLVSGKDRVENISPDTLKSFVQKHSNEEIDIGYTGEKDTNINNIKLTPKVDKTSGKAMIGIAMDQIGTIKLPVFKAFWEGMKSDWYFTKGTVVGLYTLIAQAIQGKGSMSDVTGPVGMIKVTSDASKFGFAYLLSFAALISINLAVINLFPFPALDGGRLLFLLIEKIKGSRINPKFANTANMVGFGILILLMLFVTYHDVVKLF